MNLSIVDLYVYSGKSGEEPDLVKYAGIEDISVFWFKFVKILFWTIRVCSLISIVEVLLFF